VYAGDSGPTAAQDAAGAADAASAVTSDGATRPLAPRATPCAELDLPEVSAPLEAVGSLALTGSRLYLGRQDGLYAFERQGACATGRLAAFETDETRRPVLGLAPGVDDSVLVARPDGLVLIGANGQRLADYCSASTITSLSTRDTGDGIAVLGTQSLVMLSFDAQSCSTSPLDPPDPAYAILAATADPGRSTFVVGLQRAPAAPPTLTRISTVQDASGPCSISGLAPASSTIAVLDPACGAVRFIDVEANTEPFRLAIPAPLMGRAVATVPESQGTETMLAAVNPVDAKPSLWVISTRLP
jgi:hypothetical protein